MVGELKRKKTFGNFLQQIGRFGAELFDNHSVGALAGHVGKAIGQATIPIPFVGGAVGKYVGKSIPNKISYASGLIGEIGGAINGEKSMKDILTYIPNRMVNDIKDSNLVQVITGQKNWRDGIMDMLEDEAMISWLAPGKTHAWETPDGKIHKEYVDGAKMVVGTWKNNVPEGYRNIKPDLNSNSGILGIGPNGEVMRKGFDDARWEAYQRSKGKGK